MKTIYKCTRKFKNVSNNDPRKQGAHLSLQTAMIAKCTTCKQNNNG